MAVNGCRASPVLFGWMEGTKAGGHSSTDQGGGSGGRTLWPPATSSYRKDRNHVRVFATCREETPNTLRSSQDRGRANHAPPPAGKRDSVPSTKPARPA